MCLRTQSITSAANYMKYKINKTLQNTAAQNKSGLMRMTFCELSKTKLLNFVLNYLWQEPKQYYSP